jgi:hypothetical protein
LKNKPNLRMVRMDLSVYIKGEYEGFHALRRRKNKPNSIPNKANFDMTPELIRLGSLFFAD